jgi:hypothetical protein
MQCYKSGLDPAIMVTLDLDSQSGSELDPGGQKCQKIRRKSINLIFLSAGCSLLRAEGFSCSSDVLKGGLGISKLQLLIKKRSMSF